ncbi:MAG: hypothetical protein M5R38_11210 [Candidatus Methylomirabilis sp.]|nr:hypothetical protein [Candidatus Methylomirabilis sp.]
MKRFLQLLGEMRQYRLAQAKLALQELVTDDELVIVVPEQSLIAEIQQWATSQGLTVAAPKKMLDGLARWQLSVKKAVPAPAVEAKPATAATAAAPAAKPAPATTPSPATAPAAAAPSTPSASPAASGAPAATPTPTAAPAPADAPTPVLINSKRG